jgi:DNA-directed RNA polymerase subunit RPC12/RpoP
MKFHDIVIKTPGDRLIFSDTITGHKFIQCPNCDKMALIIDETLTNALREFYNVYKFKAGFEIKCPHCGYLKFEDEGGRIL